MDSTYFAKLIGVTLLGIALIISAYKKKVLLSISLIVIGIAFIILMNNIN